MNQSVTARRSSCSAIRYLGDTICSRRSSSRGTSNLRTWTISSSRRVTEYSYRRSDSSPVARLAGRRDRVGLGEVAFMDLPESFQPGDLIPREIDGTLQVSSSRTGQEFGPPGEPAPGLAQEWYAVANPGSKAGLDDAFNSNSSGSSVPSRGSSWWTGSSTALDGVPAYPAEVDGVITGDNYSVPSTGEILIEESGLYRFTDGVDDFAYLAIDADRSGVAGDSDGEVLIEDNSWTDVLTGGNAGGAIGEIDIQDVAAEGEWLALEFNMGEATGGDNGVIYWDYSTETGIGGNELFFPLVPEDAIFDEFDAEVILVPDSHLRSSISELIAADAEGSHRRHRSTRRATVEPTSWSEWKRPNRPGGPFRR